MSLEERTLVVRCNNNTFDVRITRDLLWELFLQSGPVSNVVLRPDHAFIEFSEKCSVGYALALMEGTTLYGQLLVLSPKIESEETFKYVKAMSTFNYAMQCNPNYFYQYLPKQKDPRSEYTSPQYLNTTSQYHQQRSYSNDTRNYRDSDKIKYSSYSDLNSRSSPHYSNYSDNRQQRDNYDHFNRRHSYTNSQHNRYTGSHHHQQQQQQQPYNSHYFYQN